MWELDLWGFPVVPVCRYLVLWVQIFSQIWERKHGSVFSVVLLTECFCRYRLAALHNTHMDAGSHGFPTEQRTVQTSSVYRLQQVSFLIFRDFLLCTLKMFIKLELVYMTLLQTCLMTMKWCSLSVSRSQMLVSQRVLMNNVTTLHLLLPSRLMLSTSNVTESAHSPCYKLRCRCVLHSCPFTSLVLTSCLSFLWY